MKTTNRLSIVAFAMLMLFNTTIFAQEETRPKYVVATTMHWNMDYEGFDMDTWKAVEKEYMDKVVKKNDLIISARFYMHRFTGDNTELIYVQTFANWEDIDKAGAKSAELEKAAWPSEAARKAFLKKQGAYYSNNHSDEIYETMSGGKPLDAAPTKDMILYIRKSHFAFPEGGTNKEFDELFAEYSKNVTHKNEFIKGYYPNYHAWGADKTEFLEAIILDSMDDLDDLLKKDGELFEAHWKDETARKAFDKNYGKYFTGVHGDYIYTMIHGISE